MKICSKGYVPKVLVAGDPNVFRAQLDRNRPVNVVGAVAFVGSLNGQRFDVLKDQKCILNGKPVELNALSTLDFDHLVFNDHMDFLRHSRFLSVKVLPGASIVTLDFFACNVGDRFDTYINGAALFKLLERKQYRTLLDVDSYFAEGQHYVKPATLDQLSIEGLRSDRQDYPININLYDRIYDSHVDCRFRHYDAVLLSAERDRHDLRAAIYQLQDMADAFIIFVRRSSNARSIFPVGTQALKTVNGSWVILHVDRPSDMAIYVVTHKTHNVELPEGYVTIHAGRALSNDLSYLGDDTGDNISDLNPYLNELTALYWIWKNDKHDLIGISHYRRYFTTRASTAFDQNEILTIECARELLRSCDMIIGSEAYSQNSQRGLITFDAEFDAALADAAIDAIKKMLERHQPNYVDAFEQVMSNQTLFGCNMMITRKHVFDAYCQWLFSFLLPTAEEFIKNLENVSVRRKRILGFVAERMFGAWLLNNRLRLHELFIMLDK